MKEQLIKKAARFNSLQRAISFARRSRATWVVTDGTTHLCQGEAA